MATQSEICIIAAADGNTPILSCSRPYPPTKRDGIVDEHDKPFFYYGHLGLY